MTYQGARQYEVEWVSPTNGKWRMQDGAMLAGDGDAVAWAKGLSTRRECDGLSKGTLYELVGGSRRVVAYLGGKS